MCMQVDIGDGVLLNHAYRHLVHFAPFAVANQQTTVSIDWQFTRHFNSDRWEAHVQSAEPMGL